MALGHSLDGTQDQLDHHRQENERQFHISKELNLQGRVTHCTRHGGNALVKRRMTKYDGLDTNDVTGVKRYDLRVCEKTELLKQFQIIMRT